MTSENFENIFKPAKQVALSAEEKTTLRGRLLAFMKLKPVRNQNRPRQEYWSNFFIFISKVAKKPMPIILSIIILFTAGTSLAAEQALPGDLLYPVKIGFNEEARSVVTLTSKDRASWEIRRAERRLEEAEVLSSESKLNEDVSERIRENFEQQADRVREQIDEFESRDEMNTVADLSARFETSLRAHEKVLQKIATTSAEGLNLKGQINELRGKVKARADEEAQNRVKIQAGLKAQGDKPVKASAESRMKSAQEKISAVRNTLSQANLSADARAKAQAKLDLAVKLFEEGTRKLGEGNYAEAFRLFSFSNLIAEEAKVMMDLNARLNVEVEFETHEEIQDEPDGHNESEQNQGQEIEGKVRGKSSLELELKI